jgi:hypothetical protein
MPSASNNRLQTVLSILLSFVIATGLWYIVVGRDHVETQIDLRVEYRGLPEGLIMKEGLVNHLSVRLRGSAELLRSLHSRDIVYTADLSKVQRGANALPLRVDDIPDFKAFEILEVIPNRLVLEADALTERVVPLSARLIPLPKDSPYLMDHVILEPSFVTVKGPETQVNSLENLTVIYDPTKNASEGPHEANVAIAAPVQVEITPPVTTLRYTLEPKTRSLRLERSIQIEDEGKYAVVPKTAEIQLSIPELLSEDHDYLDAVHLVVRPPSDMTVDHKAEVPLLAMLPSGAKLESLTPAAATITLLPSPDDTDKWTPAASPFSMPAQIFGLGLSDQRITRDFSLDDVDIPPSAIQPDDLKVQPVIPSDAGAEKAEASARTAPNASNRSADISGQRNAVSPQPAIIQNNTASPQEILLEPTQE